MLEKMKRISLFLVTGLAVGMVIFALLSLVFLNQTERQLFGYRAFIVQSDSMAATDFSAGDVIFVKSVDAAALEAGDVVSFLSFDASHFGEVITHKIRRRVLDESGVEAFVTFGTTTDIDDSALVYPSQLLGVYQGRIAKLGYFLAFLKTVPGYLLFVFLPFVILILSEARRAISLFREIRRDKQLEISEVGTVDSAEFERLKQELEVLKAQLEKRDEPDGG